MRMDAKGCVVDVETKLLYGPREAIKNKGVSGQ